MQANAARFTIVIMLAAVVMSCGSATGTKKTLSDPEIAMVIRAANDGEIQQANVALPRLTDSAAIEFAEMMVRDHSAANDRLQKLLGSLNATAADSAASRTMRSKAIDGSQALVTIGGAALDRTYVEGQVKMQREVLDAIDKTLYPAAHDPALRNYLTELRASVAAHLAQAETLERDMPR
jgi:putative membrane protein